VALASIAAVPAGALAAGEESAGGGSTGGETGTESSTGSTESAPPASSEGSSPPAAAPPSSGWVPQGGDTEASKPGASARRGSSLGSGANPKQAAPADEQPSYSGDSGGGYSEPESSTLPAHEESASRPRAVSQPDSVESRATATASHEGDRADIGSATPVASPESPHVAGASAASPAEVVASNVRQRSTPDSGDPPLPILIVGGLILLYTGARLLLGPVEPPDFFSSGPFQRVRRALSRV
jgi:hypothetical protein